MSNSALVAVADHGLWFLNGHVRITLSNADNADGISIIEHIMPFGDAPPLHIHHDEDEIFMIMEGEIRFRVGDLSLIGRAGDTLCAPRGVPHAYRVTSPKGARAFTVTRGGFEAMVVAMSRPAQHLGLPVFVEPTPEMQKALTEACAEQRIDIIGPPLE